MAKFSYPKARQTETTETFHKTHTIDNKYDWMEAPDAEETVEFCKAQNVVTHDFLNSYPHRAQLKAGFESANDYEKYGTPFKGSEESPFWYCWYRVVLLKCRFFGLKAQILGRERSFEVNFW